MDLLERAPIELKSWLLNWLGSFGVPEWILAVLSAVTVIGTVIGVFLGLFALASVLERKILARAQNRYGPNRVGPFGLFQPVADGIKMITKEDLVPRAADRVVHFLAPVVMMVPALMVLAILPYGRDMVPAELDAGILYFFAVGAGTEVAVFMAGWASNNKYSVLGAMRAIAQMISYEIPLVIAAIITAMISGSLSPSAIVAAQGGFAFGFLPQWFALTPWGFTACLLFYIGALAESNRSPFDLPEGESELVAGHLTEYSGFKYATFFMAEYVGMFAVCGMLVTLFLGGWQAPLPFLAIVPTWCWFLGKICFVAFTMIWVRATLPRLRIDHLLAFAWKFLLPMSFAAFFSAACWHYAGRGPLAWLLSLAIVAIPYLILGASFSDRFSVSRRTYQFSE
ncbi:MAG: NADH-quinone oxidoreductase subunit NuoH [Terrimicrobiaceae bacterium]